MIVPPRESPSLGRILREKQLWLVTALAFAFIAWPLAVGRTYFFRDLHLWSIPQRGHLGDIVRSGHLPLWDRLTHGGQPLVGDVNNLALYPTAALCLVLPPVTAVNLEIALHFALAAAALYALARVVGMTPAISLFASITFTLCGVSLSLANLWNRLFAMPCMVLLLLFWHLYGFERRYRWFLLAAAAGSLQLYAGSLETLLLSLPLAIGWTLVFPYPEPAAPRRRRVAAALLLALVILGLSAAQVGPMLQILSQSARSRGMSGIDSQAWSINPRRLPDLVVPGFFGSVQTLDERDYWGSTQEDAGFPYLLSLYAGLTACLLAASAVVSRENGGPLPRRVRRFLGAASAAALLLSLGRYLPGIADPARTAGVAFLRYPAKFLLPVPLCVCLLAASRAQGSLDPQAGRDGRPRRLAAAFGISLLLLLAALAVLKWGASGTAEVTAFFFGRQADPRIVAGLTRGLVHAALAAASAAAIFLWRSRGGDSARGLSYALAITAGIDLGWAGAAVNATAPRWILEKQPPLAAVLRAELGDGRLFRTPRAPEYHLRAASNDLYWLTAATREALLYNTATAFGIPVIYDEDLDGLESLRMVELTADLSRLPWDRRLPILSAGSVRAVVTGEPVAAEGLTPIDIASVGQPGLFAYRNERAAALAELATFWRFAASPAEARGMLVAKGFDPRRHAVLEGGGPPPSPGPCARPSVRTVEQTATSTTVQTDSSCAGVLVFSEPFSPGWDATVDGAPAAVRPANAAFSAVLVPIGRHEIRRIYRPRSLAAGALVCLATLLALVAGSRVARRA